VDGVFLGNTCLHDAAEAGSVRIVKELLAAGENYDGFLFKKYL
jgi:ankyrin repeat protein